ncbi:MAG TPA: hypothetical protein VL068_06925 [Microthrixaceae bacterium]|nr:hypothetical protein [Microthrixaceae bacterium]
MNGSPENSGGDAEDRGATGVQGSEDTTKELAKVRAELDATRSKLDDARAEAASLRTKPYSRHRIRRTTAGILVAISCLSFLTGVVGIWANRSLLDTEVWVDHVGPLGENPEVQAALSARITAETMKLIDPDALFREALPERGQILAGPLSSAVETFVGKQVDRVVASPQFERLWVRLNTQVHSTAVKVLRGDSEVVQATEGAVTLNLVPIINEVLARLTSVSPELFGRTINIPDVQIDEIPSAAITKINRAFGTNLPPDFGQITIYDQGKLKEVQDVIALFDTLVWASVALFVVSTIGALGLSVDRRRTLIELAIVDGLFLILLRRVVIAAQNQLLDLVPQQANRGAVKAVTDAVLQGLFDGTRMLMWMAGLLILLAWVTGPSARSASLRRHTISLVTGLATAAHDRGTDPSTTAWVVAHRDLLRIAGVALAVVLFWWVDMSWIWLLIVLIVLGAYEVVLSRLDISESDDDSTPPDSSSSQSPGPGMHAPVS